MKTQKTMLASIKIERNDDGFLASIPDIQGAFAEGDTIEEAIFNCIDVIKMIVEYRKERGEELGIQAFNFSKSNSLTFSVPIGI